MPVERGLGEINIPEGTAPTTPPSGTAVIYFLANGHLHYKDDTGTEYGVVRQATGTGIISVTSGVFQMADGTAALPAYTFGTATDMGMFQDSGSLGFSTGGARRWFITSAGNFRSNNNNGASIQIDAATATVPTLVPNRGSITTGLGGASGTLAFIVAGATVGLFSSNAGQLQLPGTGSTGGLLIGGDASFYRSSAGVLSSNSHITSSGWFVANYGSVGEAVTFGYKDGTNAAAISFGSAYDASIFRSSAGVLGVITHLVLGTTGTPGNLYANGSIYAGNGAYARVVLDGANSSVLFSDGTNTWDATLFRLLADTLSVGVNDMFSLSRAGGTHPADASSAIGDKIPMWGTALDATRYGFGVQSAALVAYVGTGGHFQVRAAAASGQASSGAAGIALVPNGTILVAEQGSAPATPAAGFAALYAKSDGKFYRKDDAGVETELGGGGGATSYVWDGSTYVATTRNFYGPVDPTEEGFTGSTGDGWVAVPDGDYVTQDEFDAQGPSGRQLAYASSTAYQSAITASDLTGLSITFTVGSRPVKVRAYCPYVISTGIATYFLSLMDAAGGTIQSSVFTFAGTSYVATMIVEDLITTPGTYTRKANLTRNSGSATVSNGLSPSGYYSLASFIEAVEQ